MAYEMDSTVVRLTNYDGMPFSRAQEDLPQYSGATCKTPQTDVVVPPQYFSPQPSYPTSHSHGSHDSITSSSISLGSSELDTPSNGSYDDPTTIDEKLSMYWRAANESVIREPYDYIAGIPGKEIRRILLEAFNVWYKVDEQSCQSIAATVTMAHNASLLIDDIQDNSKLRRGVPCAHEVYGIAQTINSANYVYFLAQEQLFRLRNWPQAIAVFNEEMVNLHRGQGMELFWRDNLVLPSTDEYLQMIANKTGGLFRMIVRLLQTSSKHVVDVEKLVDVLGLYFQILDDYKNIREEKMAAQKGFFEDLTEGKFSFPICHAVREGGRNRDDLLDMMRLKTEDMAVKLQAVHILDTAGSLDYTREVLYGLDRKARSLLQEFKVSNTPMEALLDRMLSSLQACR
ncbi:isoprenoid synthase domain-containing protein [Aspergillus bertholletiae]|uniref:Isoprenoid synthase domain-containing protein n=1 Tax=Aspergillus bertholletiae TaxID=1226010 RepID=A0A5N7B2U5_9EURO|nr:isoprenoid synthase domain-containing protein [Aspergillus bertholletiae]